MATFLSQLVSAGSGKIGGLVFLNNGMPGIQARAWVKPVNPQSNHQSIIRSCFASVGDFWKTLDETARVRWKEYADTCNYSNGFGKYTVTGRNMFIAVQSFAAQVNVLELGPLVVNYDPPSIAGWYADGNITPAAFSLPGDTGIAFGVSNSDITVGLAVFGRSMGYNVTRNNPAVPILGSTRDAFACPGQANSLIQIGGLTEGAVYFVRVRMILQVGPYRISPEVVMRLQAVTIPVGGKGPDKSLIKMSKKGCKVIVAPHINKTRKSD